jgi:hypothetical protein
MHDTSVIERMPTELEGELFGPENSSSLRQTSAYTNEITSE